MTHDRSPTGFFSTHASMRYVLALIAGMGGLSHVNTNRISDRLAALERSEQRSLEQMQTMLGRRDRESDQNLHSIRREVDFLERRVTAMEDRR